MKIIKVVFWGPVLILRAITMPESYQDQRFFEGMLVAIFGFIGISFLFLLIFVAYAFAPIFSVLGVAVYFLLRMGTMSFLKKGLVLG
ncbi:MAG: hypothetical protein WCF93_02280 [Candidatus Moraniibacteriota bacterium]